MDKGWVKLHRAIFENHFLMNDDVCFVLFTKILLSAGKNKGEVAGGRKQLAKKYNMPEYVFYRAMKRLEAQQIVHIKSHKLYTTYTICNWHKYQSTTAQVSAPHPHNARTAPAHSNKKENKEKEVMDLNFLYDKQPTAEHPERASRDTVSKIREKLAEQGIIKKRSMA